MASSDLSTTLKSLDAGTVGQLLGESFDPAQLRDLGAKIWASAIQIGSKEVGEVADKLHDVAGALRGLDPKVGRAVALAFGDAYVATVSQRSAGSDADFGRELDAQHARKAASGIIQPPSATADGLCFTLKGNVSPLDLRNDIIKAVMQGYGTSDHITLTYQEGSSVGSFPGAATATPGSAVEAAVRPRLTSLQSQLVARYHSIKAVELTDDGKVRVAVGNHFNAWDAERLSAMARKALGHEVSVDVVRRVAGDPPVAEILNGYEQHVWPDGSRTAEVFQPTTAAHTPAPESLRRLGVISMETINDVLSLRMPPQTSPEEARRAARAAQKETGSDYVHVWLDYGQICKVEGSVEPPFKFSRSAASSLVRRLREENPAFNRISLYGWYPKDVSAVASVNDTVRAALAKEEREGGFQYASGLSLTVDPMFDPNNAQELALRVRQELGLGDVPVTVNRENDGNNINGGAGGDAAIAATYSRRPQDAFRKG